MIERQVVQGRGATVAYLTNGFEPVEKAAAELVKVTFDDGQTLWLTPTKQEAGNGNQVGRN